MRRIRWTVSTVLALLLFGAFVPSSPIAVGVGSDCTKVGTKYKDELAGSNRMDIICALGDDDYVAGRGGPDVLRGGLGNDTVVGSGGQDALRGGAGDDRIFASADGKVDHLAGGPGIDSCYGDQIDFFNGCEKIVRHTASPTVVAMAQAFSGSVTVGEKYQKCFAANPSCTDADRP